MRPRLAGRSAPQKQEGAGNAGCAVHPQSRVDVGNTRGSHYRLTENTRHFLRNGFTAYFVLFLVTGLCCHHRPREGCLENLTPASGRQNHTTSPSASALFVKSASASTASHAQRS